MNLQKQEGVNASLTQLKERITKIYPFPFIRRKKGYLFIYFTIVIEKFKVPLYLNFDLFPIGRTSKGKSLIWECLVCRDRIQYLYIDSIIYIWINLFLELEKRGISSRL